MEMFGFSLEEEFERLKLRRFCFSILQVDVGALVYVSICCNREEQLKPERRKQT